MLTSAAGAVIDNATGVVTIVNDDDTTPATDLIDGEVAVSCQAKSGSSFTSWIDRRC